MLKEDRTRTQLRQRSRVLQPALLRQSSRRKAVQKSTKAKLSEAEIEKGESGEEQSVDASAVGVLDVAYYGAWEQ